MVFNERKENLKKSQFVSTHWEIFIFWETQYKLDFCQLLIRLCLRSVFNSSPAYLGRLSS